MNISWLEKLYAAGIIVIFGGIVLHAPLSVGFGTLFTQYDLLIKSWKEILMLMLVPLAVIIVSKRHLWAQLAKDWIFRLIAAYAALHILLTVLLYKGAAAVAAGLAIDFRYILFFGLVYVLIQAAPRYHKLLLKVGIVGATVVVGFATLQLFLPPDILKHIGYGKDTIVPYLTVDQNPDYVRVNSTLRGPNPLGAYAGMVLILLAAAVVRRRLEYTTAIQAVGVGLLTLCSAIALWISYSRSAWLGAIAGVAVVFAVTIARRLSKRVWVAVILIVGLIIGGIIAGQNNSFISNVILHEDPNEGNSINSNDGHLDSLIDGTSRMAKQPFGAGVGSTGSASLYTDSPVIIENQFLFIAHETGWLGLGLFFALLSVILYRLWCRRQDWLNLGMLASGIGMIVIGMLLPVWADDTVAIIWWGLAAMALAKGTENG